MRSSQVAPEAVAQTQQPETAWDCGDVLNRVSGPFVYLDLTLCHGEALGQMLARTLGPGAAVSYHPGEDRTLLGYYRPEVIELALRTRRPAEQSGRLFVAGPFSAGLRRALPPSRLFTAMLRNPIDRILEGYVQGGISLAEVAAAAQPGWKYEASLHDHLTRSLAGDATLDPSDAAASIDLAPIDARDFARILADVSQSFVLLGVAERRDESLVALVRQLGLPLAAAIGPWLSRPLPVSHQAGLEGEGLQSLRALNHWDLQLYALAQARLDALIAEDASGFARDLALLAELATAYGNGATPEALAAMELEARPPAAPRLSYPPLAAEAPAVQPGSPAALRGAYLDLIEDTLINRIYGDRSTAAWAGATFNHHLRDIGADWPSQAHSMVGRRRMNNIRRLCEKVVQEGVPGDFIETGVWRGGVTIMMRAVLNAYGDTGRTVYVADSFEGVPPPNPEQYPADAGDVHFTAEQLAISQAVVAENFRRYGLLDTQVRFLPGWFKDSLPGAPIERLAILRLDGDLYESTMDALDALYGKLSPGGFVVVDDFGAVPACRAAIEEFRATHGITAELTAIDWGGVYWRKQGLAA
ncbi:TylF/MycF/NovP-related O-methyltransferase [Sediminicoccus sp. KRV36]|uniref:TylF/MycF/NovP-related O-methyltransferase n=1 Tax=Sediminicoccus sp. KRV36 TaxID=3133721 RepID=UPI00201011B2|nr:TylF/MycF/NovP-related O-methyltransferase [Sediminicoccus rosea]UPY38172.1 class I SAM-dependent methyltransferase [Sediminicoccus rosea]